MYYPFCAILFIDSPTLTIKTVADAILSYIVRRMSRTLCNDTANQSCDTFKI